MGLKLDVILGAILLATAPLVAVADEPALDATDPVQMEIAAGLYERGAAALSSGQSEEAVRLLEEGLAIWRTGLGDSHPSVALGLDTLGRSLRVLGRYELARSRFEEALAIRLEVLGEEDLDTAATMNNLALVLHDQGDFAAARPLYEQSLRVRRALLGEDHTDVADSVNNIATLVEDLGDYPAARVLYEESIAIYRTQGDDNPSVATGLNNLALLLYRMGETEDVRPLLEESLTIRRRVYDDSHLLVATSLNNLAGLLLASGDYVAARPLIEKSLAIRIALLGEDHPDVASILDNLAGLLNTQGDYAAAMPLMERSLAISIATFGERHPAVARRLDMVAQGHHAMGSFSAARPIYEQSLAISRSLLGDQHPNVADSLNNLGGLAAKEGDFGRAHALYDESLAIRLAVFGEDNPEVSESYNNLGGLAQREGDYATARDLYERCLAIQRAAFGDEHPKVSRSLDNLAWLLELDGQPAAARPLRAESLAYVEERLSLFDALSEREALVYFSKVRKTLDGWLAAFDTAEYDVEAWTHVLPVKGAIAARLSAARVVTQDDSEAAALAAELADVRHDLARQTLSAAAKDHQDRISELAAERDRLERDLLRRSASRRTNRDIADAGPAELCAALPEGAALVDFLRYARAGQRHYVAFTIMAGTCEVHRTELGLAQPLEDAVTAWREVMNEPGGLAVRVDVRGARVTELLWTPLVPWLGTASHLFVVPDGALAAAPLAALPTGDGRYLLEDRSITWLDRSNDLLLPLPEPGRGALVVGNVDYDATSASEAKHRGSMAPCNDGNYVALPGAAAESKALAGRWRRSRPKESLIYLGGASATEAAVTDALRGKAVVHLATHGFFATGRCRSALEDGATVGFDPMILSGLVLAGANQPVDPLAPEDGILTGAEVAALDLTGTGLVVLSACETGLGEVRSGEGVLGLRRAFRVAGVRTLLMTLWSVSDNETAALMDEVYRLHLHRRRPMGAADALRAAQLGALKAQRATGAVEPGTWAGFVAAGDWR